MKKLFVAAALTAALFCLTGCGTGFPNGLIYTQLNMPLVVNNIPGVSESDLDRPVEVTGHKYFGLIVTGDVSYEKAIQKANFGQIQRVEYFSYDICGCGYFGIRVYGVKKEWKDDGK